MGNRLTKVEKNKILENEAKYLVGASFNEYIPQRRCTRKEKSETRKRIAKIFRNVILRKLIIKREFGIQLAGENLRIKRMDIHPIEPKHKIYSVEEIGKRLYKKIDEVKKD